MTLTEELLYKHIEGCKAKIAEHSEVIKHLRINISKEDAMIKEAYTVLQTTCKHSNIDVQQNYTSGGYDYRSNTETIRVCMDCTLELSRHNEEGSFN